MRDLAAHTTPATATTGGGQQSGGEVGVVLYVTYAGTTACRFDQAYYTTRHLPLVMQAWQRYGLESVSAFFPAAPPVTAEGPAGTATPRTIAVCECRFRDAAAITAAFAGPEAAGVMADVPRFTDLRPARARSVPV